MTDRVRIDLCHTCADLGEAPWPSDDAGPTGLLPALLLARAHAGMGPPPGPWATSWLRDAQNVDGGWGRTLVSVSCPLATALVYTALRISGVSPHEGFLVCARRWLRDHGGVGRLGDPGAAWLALTGVFPWDAVPGTEADRWLAADPACGGCVWRVPVSALATRRVVMVGGDAAARLRRELWVEDAPGWVEAPAHDGRALAAVDAWVHTEDRRTQGRGRGPVTQALLLACAAAAEPRSLRARRLAGVQASLWG